MKSFKQYFNYSEGIEDIKNTAKAMVKRSPAYQLLFKHGVKPVAKAAGHLGTVAAATTGSAKAKKKLSKDPRWWKEFFNKTQMSHGDIPPSNVMESFKQYSEGCSACNVGANELVPGDHIENINPECDHFKSKGIVIKIKKIPQDEEKTAGRVIIYKVSNDSSEFSEDELNGLFNRGDKLAKTEIQLRKLLPEYKKGL